MKSALKLLLLSIFTFLFSVYYTSPIYALTLEQGPVLVNPSSSYSACSNPGFCTTAGGECWNSQSPGVTDCGTACRISGESFGSAWTKYQYGGCVQIEYDDLAQKETCSPVYNSISVVYSTADKCSDGSNNPPPESYLRSGSCDGSIGGIYKTCCSSSGGVTSDSCVPITPFSGAPTPPMDGVCPGGSTAKKCGYTDPDTGEVYPACGQAACGSTGEPPPPEQPPPGPSAPSLTQFEGYNPTGEVACFKTGYKANLSWSGTPFDTGSCGTGFWVDIDDNPSFSSYSNKCVPGTSTSAPDGFGGPGGAFTFNQGTTYYARVYNGTHSNTLSMSVPGNICDTNPPRCNAFSLNPATQTKGQSVNISATVSEPPEETYPVSVEFFRNSTKLATLDNNLQTKTYSPTYGWDTGSTACPGTYTIQANSIDVAGNPMDGARSTPLLCKAQLALSCPPCPTVTITGPSGTIKMCTASQITLRWEGAGEISSYNIRVDDGDTSKINATATAPSGTTTCPEHDICINGIPPSTTSLTITVNPNVSYEWWVDVIALNPSCSIPSYTDIADFNTPCTIPPSCTLNANPACGTAPLTTTLTASLDTTGMPDSKRSQWDLNNDGFFEITNTALSQSATYSTTTTPRFRAWDPVTATALSEVCRTTVTVSSSCQQPPPDTGGPVPVTCLPGPPYGCTSSINMTCQATDATRNAWCQTNYSQPYCQYCPPPPDTSTVEDDDCDRGRTIAELSGSIACLDQAGKSISCRDISTKYALIKYPVVSDEEDSGDDSASNLPGLLNKILAFLFPETKVSASTAYSGVFGGEIFRSGKRGFIGSSAGSQIGENPGSQGGFIERSLSTSNNGYTYYQLQSYNSAGQSTASGTDYSWLSNSRLDQLDCDEEKTYHFSVRNLSTSSITSTSLRLSWRLGIDKDKVPEYYALYKNGQIGYIDSASTTKSSRIITRRSVDNNCDEEDEYCYDISYTLGNLTPGTIYNLNIGWMDITCSAGGRSIPTESAVSATTRDGGGPASAPSAPGTPSTGLPRDTKSLAVNFSTPSSGNEEGTRVYRSRTERWSKDIDLETGFDGFSFYAMEDLDSLATGTYYYGLNAEWDSCDVQSNQTEFTWIRPVSSWIQTTGGDVHSNVKIDTPGGP